MREIMYYLKMQEEEQSTVGGGETPALPRLHLLPCTTSEYCTLSTDTNTETAKDHLHILLGCVYEIDHNKLPPRTHAQLRSARVVVVSEKTESNISVRFPSTQSLRSYLSSGTTELCPELDERFVMGARLAEKMLIRQVPSQEFVERRSSKDFWQLISNSDCGIGDFVISDKAGSCLPELKCNGMVRWGVRHQVKFINRRAETTEEDQEESKQADQGENDEETYESEQNDERKRCSSGLDPKGKKAKLEKQSQIDKTRKNNCKQIGRWSAERYKVAEKNLLEVMKAKGALYKSPILRAELRLEARKRIGDTGLLDHLLKHMAGKVAPGGAERFRRRHNAEGVMEYWLESADLVDVRREAGVRDPYWTPPPGWKTGDCPSQDPICAKELKELNEETSKLERDLEELVSKKQMGEEIAKLRMDIEEELLKKCQETVPLNPMITLEKYMEEVVGVSRYVSRIQMTLSNSVPSTMPPNEERGQEERWSDNESEDEVWTDPSNKVCEEIDSTQDGKELTKNGEVRFDKPKEGMKFDTLDDAYLHYCGYAKESGFAVSKRTCRKGKDGKLRDVTLSCSRGGKQAGRTSNPLKPRPQSRINCPARIRVLIHLDGMCTLNKVVLDHNHANSPGNRRYLKSNRVLDEHVKRKLELSDKAGIQLHKTYDSLQIEAGGPDKLPFLEKDCRNYLDKQRRLRLVQGDA